MIIYVTQKDIDEGLPRANQRCPIAIALQRRIVLKYVRVNPKQVQIGGRVYHLPEKARRFISDFDDGLTVKPFKFEVAYTHVSSYKTIG